MPRKNKVAITTLIISHLYLDIFNGPVFAWGIWLPAANMPHSIIDDLITIIATNQIRKFYDESRKQFQSMLENYDSPSEFIGACLNSLRLSTYYVPRFLSNKSIKKIKDFAALQNIQLIGDERFTEYYQFLKNYFEFI